MTDLQVLLATLGALATVMASFLASRYAGKSSVRVAEINADEGAFVRATEIYKGAIDRLEKENGQLRQEIEEVKAENGDLRRDLNSVKRRLDQIDTPQGVLNDRLDQLENPEA